jgi:biotin synthase-like enzyme
VRTHLGEAFTLNQLNHDHIPDTPEELRTRNAMISGARRARATGSARACSRSSSRSSAQSHSWMIRAFRVRSSSGVSGM